MPATLQPVVILRGQHVTLSGAAAGDDVVVAVREDGSLVLKPDTSMPAIHRRLGVTPASLEKVVAEYGPVQQPDGEG